MTPDPDALPEFERKPGESDLEALRRWFDESGNAEFWAKVACIECELGRRCLKTPPCEGAEVDE